jgi:hypothetical protein
MPRSRRKYQEMKKTQVGKWLYETGVPQVNMGSDVTGERPVPSDKVDPKSIMKLPHYAFAQQLLKAAATERVDDRLDGVQGREDILLQELFNLKEAQRQFGNRLHRNIQAGFMAVSPYHEQLAKDLDTCWIAHCEETRSEKRTRTAEAWSDFLATSDTKALAVAGNYLASNPLEWAAIVNTDAGANLTDPADVTASPGITAGADALAACDAAMCRSFLGLALAVCRKTSPALPHMATQCAVLPLRPVAMTMAILVHQCRNGDHPLEPLWMARMTKAFGHGLRARKKVLEEAEAILKGSARRADAALIDPVVKQDARSTEDISDAGDMASQSGDTSSGLGCVSEYEMGVEEDDVIWGIRSETIADLPACMPAVDATTLLTVTPTPIPATLEGGDEERANVVPPPPTHVSPAVTAPPMGLDAARNTVEGIPLVMATPTPEVPADPVRSVWCCPGHMCVCPHPRNLHIVACAHMPTF